MKKKLYKHKVSENPYHADAFTETCTYKLPKECYTWLAKYHISFKDTEQHRFFWDRDKFLMVMPIYDGERMVSSTGRYFGPNPDHPKYVSKGYKTGYFKLISPVTPSPVYVLVEDMLSAIRVGKVANAIPLLGTFAPRELILNLAGKQAVLRFWLDRNKADEAIKQAARARQWVKDCATIVTDLDPKEYSDEQIKGFISASLSQPTDSVSQL